jgi:Domain of unknown function (DUF4345)
LTCVLQVSILFSLSLAKCKLGINMSKRVLQVVMGVLGLIPILTGGLDLMLGAKALNIVGAMVSSEALNNVVLDSQIRFFGAIWFGVGIVLYWMLPAIEKQATLFRLLLGIIFLGGIGRLISVFLVGIPPTELVAATALELIGMPLLIWWQLLIATSNNITVHSESKS